MSGNAVPISVTLIDLQDGALAQALQARAFRLRAATLLTLDAVHATGAPDPDALLVDTRQPSGVQTDLARLRRRFPSAGLVVLARSAESAVLLDAMRLGVNEWLADPVSAGEVAAALERVARRTAPDADGHLLAVIGARGGVGATTVAVNLAAALARRAGGPTLLADLHAPLGNAADFLGVEPRYSALDAVDNLTRLDAQYLQGLVTRARCGIDVLGSTARAPLTPVTSAPVRALLDVARAAYRHVIVDVPRGQAAMLSAIGTASRVLVVTAQEVAALRQATRLVAALRDSRPDARIDLAIGRLDSRSEIPPDDVARALGQPVAFTFPGDYRTAVAALNRGEPIVGQSGSRLATAFETCAAALDAVDVPTPVRPRAGLLSRLTGR